MPTAVICDERTHIAHPDKDTETFCGRPFNYPGNGGEYEATAVVNEKRLVSVLHEELDEICMECVTQGEHWIDDFPLGLSE